MLVETGLPEYMKSLPLAAMGAWISATVFKEDSGTISKVDTT